MIKKASVRKLQQDRLGISLNGQTGFENLITLVEYKYDHEFWAMDNASWIMDYG